MVNPVFNIVSFYFGWFACLFGATQGLPWLGTAIMAALVTVHIFLVDKPQQELMLIVIVCLFGTTIDSILMISGLYAFAYHTNPFICPSWMAALWVGFASTLNHSMRWMKGRYLLGAVFGAIGGPVSYYAGLRLGAVNFLQPFWFTVASLSVLFSLIVPSCLWCARNIGRLTRI